MSKDVRKARSKGGGTLPPDCPFEVLKVFDGNTNVSGGWRVRPRGECGTWNRAPLFREWDEVLKHVEGAE